MLKLFINNADDTIRTVTYPSDFIQIAKYNYKFSKMDKLGSDVMKKMKSAIKAKLLEIGMDIDDELPDYIIVMVANKRTQAQMENDLSLFLGNHTKSFTEWLHQVIRRLESVEVSSRQKVVNAPRGQNQSETQHEKTPVQVQYAEASSRKTEEEYVPTPVSTLRQPVVNEEEVTEEADEDILNMDVEDVAPTEEPPPERAVETTRVVVSVPVKKDKIQERQKRRTIATEEEMRSNGLVSKRARRETAPASLGPQRLVSSIVRPIVRQGRNASRSEEEHDEPSRGTAGVSSVVQVTARPRRPAEAQANKKLILKAVAEAQKSVTRAPRVPELKVEKSEPIKELFTRKYLERNQGVVPEKIAVTFPNVQQPSLGEDEKPAEVAEEVEEEDSGSADVAMAETEQTHVDPQFIVTLDGITADNMGNEDEMDDYDDRESLMTVIPARQRIVAFGAKERRTTLRRRHSTGSDAPTKQTTEKCKFWPSCRLGDQCIYYHPKTPCKLLPNCTFGEKCLFVHPACKFGSSCTKKNCPYSHGKPATPATVKPQSTPASKNVACKYFPACTNPQCPFLHPPPCKFGSLCTRPGCSFYHASTRPDKNKLKWFAP